jgi:hypothetical protein
MYVAYAGRTLHTRAPYVAYARMYVAYARMYVAYARAVRTLHTRERIYVTYARMCVAYARDVRCIRAAVRCIRAHLNRVCRAITLHTRVYETCLHCRRRRAQPAYATQGGGLNLADFAFGASFRNIREAFSLQNSTCPRTLFDFTFVLGDILLECNSKEAGVPVRFAPLLWALSVSTEGDGCFMSGPSGHLRTIINRTVTGQ